MTEGIYGVTNTAKLMFTLQGTNIAAGKARGIVIGTGLNTEIGMS